MLTFYACVIHIEVGHLVSGTIRGHMPEGTDEEAALLSPVALSLHVAGYIVEAAECRGLRDALVRAHPPQQSFYSVYCMARGTYGFKVLQHTVVLAW